MRILALYEGHDAGAALWEDGVFTAAISKERLTRRKGDFGSALPAAEYCLEASGIEIGKIDLVATSRGTHLAFTRSGTLDPPEEYGPGEAHSEHRIELFGHWIPAVSIDHHRAHAAQAFFTSPFEEAAVLTMDGGGDFSDTARCVGKGNRLVEFRTIGANIGLVWNAVAVTLGLEWFHGPGKVMGLGAYGRPIFRGELLDYLGGLMETVRLPSALEIFGDRLDHINSPAFLDEQVFTERAGMGYGIPIFKGRVRQHDFESSGAKDLAASIQVLTEEFVLHLARNLGAETGLSSLAIGGGVALNPGANRLTAEASGFDDIFVPAGPNDAGLPIGLALYAAHEYAGLPRDPKGAVTFTGRTYSKEEIEGTLDSMREALSEAGISVRFTGDDLSAAVGKLVSGGIVGLFEGGSEIGPRALGHRSLLADPRPGGMRDLLNGEVKGREWFRPYAPVSPVESAGEWFEIRRPSDRMEFLAYVRPGKRDLIPAVTHIDGSARLQTLPHGEGGLLRRLIEGFAEATGVPLLLNTSLNPPGEPLVEAPREAIRFLIERPIGGLSIEGWWLERK